MSSATIDEARLETRCIRLLQAVDRGGHSVASPDAPVYCTSAAAVVAMGWMYMDLERAVRELETLVSQQLEEGAVPERVGRVGVVLPLVASVFRMIYPAARERQRDLEPRLSALVPAMNRYHLWLARRDRAHLGLFEPDDSRVFPRPVPGALVDVGLNALVVQAESDLADVAIHVGYPTGDIIARRTHRARALASRLWREELRAFSSRDAAGTWQPVAGDDLLPLWSGAALGVQARALRAAHLRRGVGFWSKWPLATLPQDAPGFDEARVGQGAVDPLLNWLLVRGLYRYGADEAARELSEATLRLAARHGMWQAYNAATGEPAGEGSWAPTAAVVLDLVKTPYSYERW